MDTRTGHLVDPEEMERIRKQFAEAGRPNPYTEVPERLAGAAKRKLAGRAEAMVSLKSGGQLARWAAQVNAKKAKAARRAKARRKIEKASRRANRK